ncbi:MAG: hypothetical protein P8J20_06250 [Novosphingobium sp.]|nr:hypothetical protein [Novosphingobium sp.]
MDFENALRSWKRGFLGGLLFYYDGRGPLGLELRKSFDARNTDAAKPEEWEVPSFVCQSERECSATTMIRFSDEEIGGLRRYRLIRKPGQFWGLFSEEKLECPAGYRLQYQGLCVNSEDERSDDPEIVVRTADPVAAE